MCDMFCSSLGEILVKKKKEGQKLCGQNCFCFLKFEVFKCDAFLLQPWWCSDGQFIGLDPGGLYTDGGFVEPGQRHVVRFLSGHGPPQSWP